MRSRQRRDWSAEQCFTLCSAWRDGAQEVPPLTIHSPQLRRLLTFILLTTAVNVVIAGQLTYKAVTYMESVQFCGQTCHTVMQPEFTAYQNSPHSRVECVKCHIGPGASWFVQSKLSGVRQVFAVALDSYHKPIEAPVENLRPARETCEACHWPQKYGADRLRIITHYSDDEVTSPTRTVLLMRIGGGRGGHGIHAAHLGEGVVIRYGHSDRKRQEIPWVEYSKNGGTRKLYLAESAPADGKDLSIRTMDCMDCHNRPSHSFETPEGAADRALVAGDIDTALPFVRKKSVEILKVQYKSRDEAAARIPEAFAAYYRESYPEVHAKRGAQIGKSAQAVLALWQRNVFPDMKIEWGTYIENIGHTNFPGCFRCHDESHETKEGQKIAQDCNSCHSLLAVDEKSPQALETLGVSLTP